MSKKTITGQVVTDYLEKFPNAASLTLARMIYRDHTLEFNSVEHARGIIRMYRGQSGTPNKSKVLDKRFFGTGLTLPEGEEPAYVPYELPKVNNRILFMSDIHLPFHDLASIHIALQDGKDKDVNTVILGGDILDMYSVSSFSKVPNKAMFTHERELFWMLIDDINAILPNAKIFMIEGNHENRFSRYMLNKAPEIFDVPDFSMRSLFAMEELSIEYIDRKQYIKAGRLNFAHGHEFGMVSSSVNPARGMYLKAKDNVLFGHLHRSSEHSESDVRGEVKSVYSVGCLCYLHPEYRPINTWNTGFALVEIHQDGSFMCKNKKIVNKKIQ